MFKQKYLKESSLLTSCNGCWDDSDPVVELRLDGSEFECLIRTNILTDVFVTFSIYRLL
jgi:hypothetical protein